MRIYIVNKYEFQNERDGEIEVDRGEREKVSAKHKVDYEAVLSFCVCVCFV